MARKQRLLTTDPRARQNSPASQRLEQSLPNRYIPDNTCTQANTESHINTKKNHKTPTIIYLLSILHVQNKLGRKVEATLVTTMPENPQIGQTPGTNSSQNPSGAQTSHMRAASHSFLMEFQKQAGVQSA